MSQRTGAGWLVPLACLAALAASSVSAGEADTPLLDALIAAYPDFLSAHDGANVVWRDGTIMPFARGQAVETDPSLLGPREIEARFAAPDLRDMFLWRYPADAPGKAPSDGADPGRIRVASFFARMYGDCARGEVERNLISVPWLPRKKGGNLRVTRVNGVADKLAAVSVALDALPARYDAYLKPSAGAYNCRAIAGTERASAHGYGIAIDLAAGPAHYWRWARPGKDGRYAWRNSLPSEIVEIFEKHGFIWGGRWTHYDTMHFEYRPEILAARR